MIASGAWIRCWPRSRSEKVCCITLDSVHRDRTTRHTIRCLVQIVDAWLFPWTLKSPPIGSLLICATQAYATHIFRPCQKRAQPSKPSMTRLNSNSYTSRRSREAKAVGLGGIFIDPSVMPARAVLFDDIFTA